ncbi:MAG: hypothetical protein NVSMB1_10790 [Polyangiales bacterium]
MRAVQSRSFRSSFSAFAPISLLFLCVVAAAILPNCSTKPGDACQGGLIKNGLCVAKCAPDKCLPSNTCIANACALVCTSHLDCLADGSQTCQPSVEDVTGKAVNVCAASGKAAGIGLPCPNGNECAQGFRCISAGVGDADAYCTNEDCGSDTDCAAGFYCGVARDPHAICGSMPPKGNSDYCGKTTEPCVEPAHFNDTGTRYVEGPICLLRHVCMKRRGCVACKTDLDCSRVPGQKCATIAGEQRCAHACARDGDCEADAKCDLALGACVPRAGACKGSGKVCDPCVNDLDCGGVGSTLGCSRVSSSMRACLDYAFAVTCMGDADCPVVASGKHGACLDEARMVKPDNPLYRKCVFPFDPVANKSSCW